MEKKREKKSNNSGWTKEEEAVILEHYGKEGADACCKLLPGRSRQAVIVRANRYLGLFRSREHA